MTDTTKKASDNATELFVQGYNCGQAVLMAFAQRYGIDEQQASHLAAAFGGGVGHQRMTCGAVLALAVLAGLETADADADHKVPMQRSFKLIQRMTEEFKTSYGSAICGEILGLKGFTKAIGTATDIPTPEQYKSRPCALKVRLAAEIFERHLKEKEL